MKQQDLILDRHGAFLAIRFPDNIIKNNVNDLTIIQNTLIKVHRSHRESRNIL